MKHIVKPTIITLILYMSLYFTSTESLAAARNSNDVAKLQQFVNTQISKGAKLSKSVTTDKCYKWNKQGRLIGIEWNNCNLIGNIKLPSFKRLQKVTIYMNPKLKG